MWRYWKGQWHYLFVASQSVKPAPMSFEKVSFYEPMKIKREFYWFRIGLRCEQLQFQVCFASKGPPAQLNWIFDAIDRVSVKGSASRGPSRDQLNRMSLILFNYELLAVTLISLTRVFGKFFILMPQIRSHRPAGNSKLGMSM